MFKTGVIPAAGAGLRLFPYTENTPKALLEIGGKSLLQRNIEIMRDKLGVSRIIIIVGHLGSKIEEKFGDGNQFGVKIEYVQCPDVRAGLAMGIMAVRDKVTEPFPVILGDEFYLNSNHEVLRDVTASECDVIAGVKITADTALIKKNYAVDITEGKISALEEKPEIIRNNYLGLGTFIFTPTIFEYIESTPASSRSGKIELIDVINRMSRAGCKIAPAFLKGDYRNINQPDDFNSATYVYRNASFDEYKVSLVIPAWNEEASIGHVIDEFVELVDEVVVADNCSTDRTALIASERGARVISQPYRGYGDALRAGIREARGDIFVLVEADASFSPDDLPIILAYLKHTDMVIGTRTTSQMIQQGANMDWFLRVGNVLAAKLLEALFWFPHVPRFTDLGCTYRAIWREAYEAISPNLSGDGPEFSPEMMVEILRANRKVIEVPVTYRPRLGGESKHSRTRLHVLKTGFKMLKLIFERRFTSLYK